jgi:hypothetical protein
LAHSRPGCDSLPTNQGKEVFLEHEAEHEQDQKAPDSDMHPAKSAAPAFVAAIFQVIASSARCPTHAAPLETYI